MAYSKQVRVTAKGLILALAYQLIFPNVSYALTSGPTQPEVQSFEPVGTTDMVDLFTGDFVYNIPLLDVEGYPINISYHGGVGMEQEASWVGLGWNINPGAVNRTVRGIPDDFKGETLTKEINIEPEENLRVGLGGGGELVGIGDPILGLSASVGPNININNYRGVSADFTFSAGVNLFRCVSVGVNVGIGSQSGADIDYNAGVQFSSSQIVSKDVAAGVGVNFGHGYNTRTGIKDMNLSVFSNAQAKNASVQGPGMNATIPIGVKNFVPVVTNSSTMTSIYGRIKIGLEFAWCNLYGNINGMGSKLEFDKDGSRKAYGYLYSEYAGEEDIMDFTRDKDGVYNKSMQYLPPGHMTYDVYTVTGQGTGGSFRPFRNDIGSVFDPVTKGENKSYSGQIEADLGWLFAFGGDASTSKTDIYSGPWRKYVQQFSEQTIGDLYENVYFKQGGELTAINEQYFSDLGGKSPIKGTQIFGLPKKKANAAVQRDPRANLVTYFNADEASKAGIAFDAKINSYESVTGFAGWPNDTVNQINRYGSNGRKEHHISEFTQIQTDGRRYVYGIPAMNNIQKEVTFSVAGAPSNPTDLAKGLVSYAANDASMNNSNGIDHFYNGTTTPAYTHSYLLTAVLSADYADMTGDGPTNDDVGAFTKFNYTLKDNDYRWRAPIEKGKAQYNPGFWSDTKDDRGSYVIGSREQWIMHSIESKNYVAEFYTSERKDGKGVTDSITGAYGSPLSDTGSSYRLDSIVLYNKHDRFINTVNANPIKTVYFEYDYSLCKGIPNVSESNTGKLTLKKIYTKYGTSEKSMLSPYRFEYHTENPGYDLSAKDRWGNYKPNNTGLTNYEFPFVDQTADNDTHAASWSLHRVHLPSGGVIQVDYESDDYAYVQQKEAMEMFKVEGVGITTHFIPGQQLYFNKHMPALYFYFKRQKSKENNALSMKSNYYKSNGPLYFNCSIKMPNDLFEQIKGYAQVTEVGYCNDDPDSDYGYVKLNPISPKGGGANINPCAYTALNVGRYNLPQIFFPGNDPNASDFKNILAGLKQSFEDLLSFGQNPVVKFLEKGQAKQINKTKSYIRLTSPGLKKEGGGHRVKSLLFYDSWNKMAGGNAQEATYGKLYDYTIDYGGAKISSGVASYEPEIGGDENPYREPVEYIARSGSNWPPNDPVDLYQEAPIGESLLPSPVVGYRQVTVSSIHKDVGRSSQGVDIHKFCTAKEYPFEIKATALQTLEDKQKFGLKQQENILEVTQGYTIILNDMHGKPKSTEHYVRKPSGNKPLELISYQQYIYNESAGKLDNKVPVIAHNSDNDQDMFMEKKVVTVGIETDITIDAREKTEKTYNDNINVNVNATNILAILVPIPVGFGWSAEYRNEFRSVVATKVIQQYGILRQVKNYNEGAYTTLTNEAYDPQTGQPVVTSINNEFGDTEYSVSYPAYWGHRTMGPAYTNVGYTDTTRFTTYSGEKENKVSPVVFRANARFYAGVNRDKFTLGDELLVKYTHRGTPYETICWVVGWGHCDNDTTMPNSTMYCCPLIAPRYPQNTPGWVLVDVDSLAGEIEINYVKILRSGRKNLFNESMINYTSLSSPFKNSGGKIYLKDTVEELISLSGREYGVAATKNKPIFNINASPTSIFYDPDGIINRSAIGQWMPRLRAEYSYQKAREYTSNNSRDVGVFSANILWNTYKNHNLSPDSLNANGNSTRLYCVQDSSKIAWQDTIQFMYSYHQLSFVDPHWKKIREVTKWSVYGNELENKDAVGNYSAASYGYLDQLPVTVSYNSRQEEVFADGFEDYVMLEPKSDTLMAYHSPFKSKFNFNSLSSIYRKYDLSSGSGGVNIVNTYAHTGDYSLLTGSAIDTVKVSVFDRIVYESDRHHLPFQLIHGKEYVVSFWYRPVGVTNNELTYSTIGDVISVGGTNVQGTYHSNIIDGWQKVECTFSVPSSGVSSVNLYLPADSYIDDIRMFPSDANMKSFVYHPFNQRLMATLDENNYATIYEYDQEGSLIRTKRETNKGIITISESRSANPKKNEN